MAVSQNFPSIAPSLTLNFASSRTLDPRITFTRTTTATCVGPNGLLKTVPADAPRFDHDPTTGESLGLLVEESRANLLLRSEEFGNWGLVLATRTLDAGIAPNGTLTADRVESTGGGVFRGVAEVANATTYTYSVFLKHVSGTGVIDNVGFERFGATPLSANSSFNVQTGVIVNNGAAVTASSITAYGNGWYRVAVTATSTDAATTIINYTSTSGNQFLIWGAQLEAGSFPTSYIPTEGSTVTRAADVASISGSNFSSWYRQDEGTVFAEASSTRGALVGFSDGTSTERYRISASTTAMLAFGTSGGSTQFNINTGTTWISPASGKGVLALGLNNIGISANGSSVVLDDSATAPVVDRMFIGAAQIGAELNGALRRVTYWPTRLPDSTLQTITN